MRMADALTALDSAGLYEAAVSVLWLRASIVDEEAAVLRRKATLVEEVLAATKALEFFHEENDEL